eukprot:TRINITY_DN5032_c0_g1_i15.p1 TRINITY_DN5032_c0_g1~~TRINITY_DN5032_c0_g1_i15.p1  ORF type:complete len:160 (+),score=39.40 TRINITY_DN5032_c0_g1_i15:262-741(+)
MRLAVIVLLFIVFFSFVAEAKCKRKRLKKLKKLAMMKEGILGNIKDKAVGAAKYTGKKLGSAVMYAGGKAKDAGLYAKDKAGQAVSYVKDNAGRIISIGKDAINIGVDAIRKLKDNQELDQELTEVFPKAVKGAKLAVKTLDHVKNVREEYYKNKDKKK